MIARIERRIRGLHPDLRRSGIHPPMGRPDPFHRGHEAGISGGWRGRSRKVDLRAPRGPHPGAGGVLGHGVAQSVYLGRWAAQALLGERTPPDWLASAEKPDSSVRNASNALYARDGASFGSFAVFLAGDGDQAENEALQQQMVNLRFGLVDVFAQAGVSAGKFVRNFLQRIQVHRRRSRAPAADDGNLATVGWRVALKRLLRRRELVENIQRLPLPTHFPGRSSRPHKLSAWCRR